MSISQTQAPELIRAEDARRVYFGAVTRVTLWRWENEVEGFPIPIKIGNVKFYRLSEIHDFLNRQQQQASSAA